MYLLSKQTFKYLGLFLVSLSLSFLIFSGFLRYSVIFISRQLLYSPKDAFNQINQLQQENLNFKLQLKEYQSLKQENEKLKKAFNFKNKVKYSLLGSEIIAFAPSSWRRFVIIDSGLNQGLQEGLYALDENGNLAGKIIQVEKDFSRLLLVNDPDFNAPVFVGKTAMGLLKGNLVGAVILYIEDEATIKAGDKVYLKIPQLASVIEVGEVSRAQKNKDSLFWKIDVNLFYRNNLFNKLFIVR